MEFEKFRSRFRKIGLLRLVSHHDLMRVLERMLRRAELPFRSTSGFHPLPRVIFALSLPVGVEGFDEVVELELTAPLAAADVLERLQRQAPAGLEFTAMRRIPLNVTAQVFRAIYAVSIPAARVDELSERCTAVLAQAVVRVTRKHPHDRVVDIRPYVRDLHVVDEELRLDFTVTPSGTARADEVLRLLGSADVLDQGAVLRRTQLFVQDETDFVPSSVPHFASHVAVTDEFGALRTSD